jgi:glycosyltransferase involved in cell wall biosynthesis
VKTASDTPLVSVILPTRNRAELARRAVCSVLAQTYARLELIVIDDASTDGTSELLATIDDRRLQVIRNDRNAGASAARNLGIGRARGELVAFHDDDDIWFVHKLDRQVEALRRASVDTAWCLCGFVRQLPASCEYIGGRERYAEVDFAHGASRTRRDGGSDWSLIATPAWVVERAMLEKVGGFDERIYTYEDWELGIRLEQVCRRTFVDEPLFLQDRSAGGGLTRVERTRASALRIIMDKHGAMWRDKPDVLARHYFLIGRIESKYDGDGAGRDFLLRALRLRPFHFRAWAALILTLFGQSGRRAISVASGWARGKQPRSRSSRQSNP